MTLSVMSRRYLNSVGIFGVAVLTLSCSTGESRSQSAQLKAADSPALQNAASPTSSPTPTNSPIRSVNFDNIAHPYFPDYGGAKKRRVTLKPGEGGPNFISYGHITGDETEGAIAALGIDIHGSATPYYVYIFTMANGRPKVIWDFETGDRADGGLRQVYAEGEQLVVELYGKDRVVGGQLYKGEEALCCPSAFTRTRYKWAGKSFEETAREVLPNPREVMRTQ
jgi:hypothetical protein